MLVGMSSKEFRFSAELLASFFLLKFSSLERGLLAVGEFIHKKFMTGNM